MIEFRSETGGKCLLMVSRIIAVEMQRRRGWRRWFDPRQRWHVRINLGLEFYHTKWTSYSEAEDVYEEIQTAIKAHLTVQEQLGRQRLGVS